MQRCHVVQQRRREDSEREDVGRPRPGTRHLAIRPRRPLPLPLVTSVRLPLWLLPVLVEPLHFLSHSRLPSRLFGPALQVPTVFPARFVSHGVGAWFRRILYPVASAQRFSQGPGFFGARRGVFLGSLMMIGGLG